MQERGYLGGLLPHVEDQLSADEKRRRYFNDPVSWAKDVLGIELWEKQAQVLMYLANGEKKSTVIRAGHGVGKSFLSAVAVCWWVDTRPINRLFVASTAPSADQVTTILWREIRNLWKLSHDRFAEFERRQKAGIPTDGLPDHALPGYITMQNRWMDGMGNVIGHGRKPPDANEDSFQGIHAHYVLAIGDEACGLKEHMIQSLLNITSNKTSRRLLIGNPTNPNTRFGELFLDTTPRKIMRRLQDGTEHEVEVRLQDEWQLFHISVLDLPTFHGGGFCGCPEHAGLPHGLMASKEMMESLSDQSYVDSYAAEYGENSPQFKIRVKGEFAQGEGLILFDDYKLGRARDASVFVPEDAYRVLSADIARSPTGDYTNIYLIEEGFVRSWVPDKPQDDRGEVAPAYVPGPATSQVGYRVRLIERFRGVPITDRLNADGTTVVGQVTLIHQHAVEQRANEVRVDKGGMGVGIIDGLWGIPERRYSIVEVQSGDEPPDRKTHINNRAFQMDRASKLAGQGALDLDRDDAELLKQAGDITYSFSGNYAAMKIESKEDMRKRGVKSPDAVDAVWMGVADLTHLGVNKNREVIIPQGVIERMMDMHGFRDQFTF